MRLFNRNNEQCKCRDHKAWNDEMDRLRRECRSLTQQLEIAKNAKERWYERYEDKAKELESLQIEPVARTDELEQVTAERDRLKYDMQLCKAETAAFESRATDLQERLEKERDKRAAAQKEAQEAKLEVERIQYRLDLLNADSVRYTIWLPGDRARSADAVHHEIFGEEILLLDRHGDTVLHFKKFEGYQIEREAE